MAWKKALFLGGAVLLLAACSDATAPSALRQEGRAAAVVSPLDATGTLAPTDGTMSLLDGDCRSGYYVRSGDKDVCVLQLDMP